MTKRNASLIAIVDDEVEIRSCFEWMLQAAGLQTQSFASGVEFLLALPELKPTCVVLDLQLPGISGMGVLSGLRKRYPVVVITGDDCAQSQALALEKGASVVLQKPVSWNVIMNAIEEATGTAPRIPHARA